MGFTSAGFVRPTLEEIRNEIVEECLALISATLDLSEDQPVGQVVAIASQREAKLYELIEVLAHAIDPNAATGFLLDFICAITGTVRRIATKSTVIVECDVDAGSSFNAGAIMLNVTGQPDVKFVNKARAPASGGFAGDGALPGVMDFSFATFDFEGELEGVWAHAGFQVRDLPGDGAPILIADDAVNVPHDLVIAQPYVAQKSGVRLEDHGQRSGPEVEGAGRQFFLSVE
jgi:hypothetical protein